MKPDRRSLATFPRSIATLLKPYLPGKPAEIQASGGTILKPYLPDPTTGWRRFRAWALLAAVVLFCLPYGFFFGLFAPYLMAPFAAPVLILACLAIWALPDMRQAPTRTLEGLYWAFLLALILWPNYLAIALPGLPWITLTRLISFPIAVILLICVSVSSKFRSREARALDGAPLVWICITGFAVIQVLTIAASSYPMQSIQRVFNSQVSWTAIFFASSFLFLKPGRMQAWAALVWASAVVVGLIGVWEHHYEHPPWADHIPGFLAVQDETVARILAGSFREDSQQYRVQSTFSTPLGLSEYEALALPFVLQFIIGRYSGFVRGLAAASAPFMVYVIMLTDSRLGLVGAFLTAGLFVLYWGVRRWRYVKNSLLGPSIVLAYPLIVAAMISVAMFSGRIRSRLIDGQYASSNEGRKEMYTKGFNLILKHPWGFGSGVGAENLGYTNSAGMLTIDTYYVAIALDYGILGFIFYYGAILSAMHYAGRQAFSSSNENRDSLFLGPLAISLASFFVIKSVFSNEDNHPLAFMMMGAVAALCARLKQTKRGPGSAESFSRFS